MLKATSSGRDPRDFQQIIDQSGQLPHLPFNDRAGLLLVFVRVLLKLQELHRIDNRGQWIAQFVTEHRQKLVFSPVEFRKRGRLLLHLPLQAAAFSDIPDIALNDFVVVLTVGIGDDLDLDSQSFVCFQRQVIVTNVSRVLKSSHSLFVGRFVAEQTDLPQFPADEMLVRVPQ